MPSSNCCFLTCIQISQEAGQVVRYSHLFQNFPQFIVIHTVKGFGIVNKAEIQVFLELSCFFNDPADVGNLISGSSAVSKTSLNIRKLQFSELLGSVVWCLYIFLENNWPLCLQMLLLPSSVSFGSEILVTCIFIHMDIILSLPACFSSRLLFFFSYCSLGNSYWPIFKFTDSFLSCVCWVFWCPCSRHSSSL